MLGADRQRERERVALNLRQLRSKFMVFSKFSQTEDQMKRS